MQFTPPEFDPSPLLLLYPPIWSLFLQSHSPALPSPSVPVALLPTFADSLQSPSKAFPPCLIWFPVQAQDDFRKVYGPITGCS